MSRKKRLAWAVRHFEVIRISLATLLAFAAIGILVIFTSQNPGGVLYWFVIGPLTSLRRFGTVFQVATNYVICSMAMCIMLRVGKFNLCLDGVFYLCMAMASIFALEFNLPAGIAPIVIMLLCALIGAAGALLPAYLEYKWNANLVVAALMLNYVWLHVGRYILLYVVNDPALNYTASFKFPKSAVLQTFIPGTSVHAGIYVAIVIAIFMCILLRRTKLGFAIGQIGNNPEFAQASGMNAALIALIAQAIGGAIIGIGGAQEVMGTFKQFKSDSLLAYGGYALLITAVAKNNPIKVCFVSVIIAYMRAGAALVNANTDIPLELADVLQGILVIFVAADLLFAKTKHKWLVKSSELEICSRNGGSIKC